MESNQPNKKSFYEEPFDPLSKMSNADLEAELKNWRNLWSWLDMEVKGYLIKVGHKYRFVRRDYQVFIGTLGKTHFEAKQLELDCVVSEKDYIKKTYHVFVETMRIPITQLISIEEIHYQEDIPLDERGEPVEQVISDVIPDLV